MSQSLPCSSPWIDFTESHRKLREELETAITDYVVEDKKGIKTHVIVAPFGSGKTTLLRHLLCFSISHGIPAIKINLSYLVEFLRSQGVDSINEDSLIGYVSLFCNKVIRCIVNQLGRQNCPSHIDDIVDEFKGINADMQVVANVLNKFLQGNNQKCVLLIDEIEESYEELKRMVIHQTTPFRDIFDRVREGKSRIFPILAFGPSSIYSEAVSGAGAWRTIQHVLPMISPLNIKDVNKQVSDSYISNLIWWVGKGRPGHIDKIIDVGLHTGAQNALNKCQSILKTNEAVRLQDVYAVANIPYIDYAAYSKIERSLDNEMRNLFYVLSTLVGPVPESLLSNYKCIIDVNRIRYSKLPDYFVKSTYLIKVNDVVSTLENVLLRLNYKMGDFARDLISALFFAWSDHDKIILDKRALTELIGIAKDLAIEFYQNDLYNALNKLDLDALYTELLNSKIESREFYYALSPSTLSSIYPPVLLMPFIGCSRDKSLDELYKVLDGLNVNDIISISDSLQREIINYASMRRILSNETIQVMSNYKMLFVPGKYVNNDGFINEVKRLLVSNDVHGVIIVPISYGQDPSLIMNSLRSIWQKYEDLGLISHVFDLSARILLFLIGSLYNKYVKCDVKYEDKELSMYGQFMNVIINLLQDAINSSLTKRNEKSQVLMYNSNIRKLVNELSNRGSTVGSGKGEYLLLLASSEHRDSLENYLETIIARREKGASTLGIIDDVKQKFEALGKKLQDQGHGYKDIYEDITEKLTRDFGLFLKNGWNYYMRIRDLWDRAYNDLRDRVDNLTDVLGDLYVSSPSYSNIRGKIMDIQELIEDELNKITAKVINACDEMIMNLITWRALQKYPDILAISDEKMIEECRKSGNAIISSLNDALGILNDIIDLINKILSKTEKYVNETAGLMSYLMELRDLINDIKNSLSKIRNYVEECDERIKGLNTAEQLWFLDFIIKDLITNLVNNVSSVIKLVNSILSNDLNEVLKRLNSIEAGLEDLKGLINVGDAQSFLKHIVVIDFDTLMEYYKYDLRQILSNSHIIKELAGNLGGLEGAISDLERVIKGLNESVQKKVEKIEKTINEIKGLVEG